MYLKPVRKSDGETNFVGLRTKRAKLVVVDEKCENSAFACNFTITQPYHVWVYKKKGWLKETATGNAALHHIFCL